LAYPGSYEELFCISAAEAQYAEAYPITSGIGALSTTNMGTIIPGNANESTFLSAFSDTIIRLLKDREQLNALQKEVKQRALERFHPDVIMKEWNKIFNEAK
jgi:glycosyltransferase involved in cell wall biosynthesis